MRWPSNIWRRCFYSVAFLLVADCFDKNKIEDCARVLGEKFVETFDRATHAKDIPSYYDGFVKVENYDPRHELKRAKRTIESYLKKRAKFAYDAKRSLESRELYNFSDTEVNNIDSQHFVRYMSAKTGGDGGTLYRHDHTMSNRISLNATKNFTMHSNANFYFLSTSSVASAVHVPTPIYDRDPTLLNKIHWSDIDQVYRTNRESTRDLAFQLFCSEAGFMRYFPAAPWFWDHETDKDVLDLFDCRNSEWYINGATCSKNVLIMLDMSGSMLGQRYEIAKQTTEAILESLSHNDFFNILPFSKEARFLDEECSVNHPMLQATMRNKKYLRAFMNNMTAEGKADYTIALKKAFETLKNMSSRTGVDKEFGCESIIMLITDGAPEPYTQEFELFNKDKSIRFFTFLIGEEATDMWQVRKMACENRGFMVHIQNMADVEEKIQNYIRVMSRPLGAHQDEINENSQIWSGVYRERLYLPRKERFADPMPITNQSFAQMNRLAAKRKIQIKKAEARGRMFVTTVSYPVILDGKFMGVAAVNIPLTELVQLAHPTEIGGTSYYFMLDYNGFIMFHPQLRPIDPATKLHKQNYNNMELLELEVSQSGIMKRFVLNCDNSQPQTAKILFASDMVDRVYPQTNTYYSECIEGSDFVLGLAVAEGDEKRISRDTHYDYGKVQLSWVDTNNFVVHPYWRYCLLNDTDSNISKEHAFKIYMMQMRQFGKLPDLCKPRQSLVDRLILDLEATAPLEPQWEESFQFLNESLIHLTFFATPSGLIRYYNFTLKGFLYDEKEYDKYLTQLMMEGKNMRPEDMKLQESYQHFVVDANRKSVEDRYFRRSIRQKGKIVFDINNRTKLWYPVGDTPSAYGNVENVTLLGQATKAIYKDDALLGVAGLEFAMDWLVNTLSDHGCRPSDWQHWCVLIDEHGYVVYSNEISTSYKDAYRDLRGGESHLGVFFAHINRVAERAMELLVEKGFYQRFVYYDHQATCLKPKPIAMSATMLRPLRALFANFMSLLSRLFRLAGKTSILPVFGSVMRSAEAYTASFHTGHDGFPCTKESPFYLSAKSHILEKLSPELVENGKAEKPCISTKCSVKMQARFVRETNLIMVWITQMKGSKTCYDNAQCPIAETPAVKFKWEKTIHNSTESKCRHVRSDRPNRKKRCFSAPIDESKMMCSSASQAMLASSVLLSLFYRGLF